MAGNEASAWSDNALPLPTERTAEDLARCAQAGSSAAFAALTVRFGPSLDRFFRSRGADRNDAEDLRQEALLRVFQKLGTYDPSRPFAQWLFTVAHRLAVTRARRRRERPSDTLADRPDNAASCLWHLAQEEECATLWQTAHRHLPARQYEAMHLLYAQRLDVRQAAQRMHLTEGHVRVLLHRARRRLISLCCKEL